MALTPHRWLDALPPKLRPRGVRYLGASSKQAAKLSGHRIYVLPTKQGLVFLGVLFLMLMGAINYGNSMAFVLTFWLGSIALVSLLYTYRNLVQLEVGVSGAEPCFAGGHAIFHLQLKNGQTRQRFDIEAQSGGRAHTMGSVLANAHTQLSLALPARQRGRIQLGRIIVSSRFPLGLFQAWAYVDGEAETLVYPRPSDQAPVAPSGQGSGEGKETHEEGSDDFHGFRNYHPGDSPRHIYWKALARQQGLVTKQFQRHQAPELWFDWNDARGSDIETRLSQLCRWLLDADNQQQVYGLRLPGITLPPAQGKNQLELCLAQLAVFGEPT